MGQALVRSVLAGAAGLSQALALADPWTGRAHGWLQLLGLALLAVLLLPDRRRPAARPARRGFGLGAVFATCWLVGTFWWLFISMHTYGGLVAPLAGAAVLALAGFLGLYYALAAAAFAHLAAQDDMARRPLRLAGLFAALWTLAELARGRWLTGFPWGAGGYAHVDSWLAAAAPWVGVYGMGFAAAWLALLLGWALAALARQLPPAHAVSVLTALLLTGALLGWTGTQRLGTASDAGTTGPVLGVALLQGNIPQDEKFIPGTGVDDALLWYGQQWQASRASLVVAPETALPLLPRQLPDGYWDALAARYAEGGQATLFGVPLGDVDAGYTNAVVGLAPGQSQPYRYDKHHLVPFGEFIPPLFRWFVNLMDIPLGDFDRGGLAQPSFDWQGQRLAPNICYEDLFGEELARRFVDVERAPTAFVNLSNIAWFGDGVAIDQHLAISRLRALEFARPMLRATNTGATAIIDHRGRVTHQLPRATRGVLHGWFEGRDAHITAYARWAGRWGLWPLGLLCVLIATGCAALMPRR